jgi:hypothetical protein
VREKETEKEREREREGERERGRDGEKNSIEIGSDRQIGRQTNI